MGQRLFSMQKFQILASGLFAPRVAWKSWCKSLKYKSCASSCAKFIYHINSHAEKLLKEVLASVGWICCSVERWEGAGGADSRVGGSARQKQCLVLVQEDQEAVWEIVLEGYFLITQGRWNCTTEAMSGLSSEQNDSYFPWRSSWSILKD